MLKEFGIYVGKNSEDKDYVLIPTEVDNETVMGVYFSLFNVCIATDGNCATNQAINDCVHTMLFNDDIVGFLIKDFFMINNATQEKFAKEFGYLGQINTLHTQAELKYTVKKLYYEKDIIVC